MPEVSRRDFLKLVRNGFLSLSGGLALGGLVRFLNFESNSAPQTEFDVGPVSEYPLNSRTVLSTPPAVIIHNESGFSAMSLICTHLGCILKDEEQGFACPCHGSRFSADGSVVHGPAKMQMQPLRVQVTNEGNLKLFTV